MAKLYFYYSSMNAGKSTLLLQSSFNYKERGMKTLLLTAAVDDRFGIGKITSRLGLSSDAIVFNNNDDIFDTVKREMAKEGVSFNCVLVDEAQFMNKMQVWGLSRVCDELNIPVLCYGIRTDFQGELFEGSKYLLAWSDCLNELKTICKCGKKANFVYRTDEHGVPIKEGAQICIGGNGKYISVCRKHFKESVGKHCPGLPPQEILLERKSKILSENKENNILTEKKKTKHGLKGETIMKNNKKKENNGIFAEKKGNLVL